MAIVALVGLPGSGKSYNAVKNQILPALKAGRRVVTNIPLNEAAIREHVHTGEIVELPTERVVSDPESIEEFATPGSVLVIDELWRFFPAGQKVDRAPAVYKSLLAEHRHRVDEQGRSMQIVFVTQDLSQIAAWARVLVDETFIHKKLGHLGMDGAYSVTVYRTGVTGQNPPQNLEVRTMRGTYDASVYRFYTSHTMSKASTDGGADEKKIDRSAVIWKRPIFLVIAVMIVGLAVFGIPILSEFFHGGGVHAAPDDSRASGATARSTPQSGHSSRDSVPAVRVRYRVSAIISGAGTDIAVLTDDAGDTVYVPSSKCEYARLQWRCEHQNQWWPMRSSFVPVKDSRPVGDILP